MKTLATIGAAIALGSVLGVCVSTNALYAADADDPIVTPDALSKAGGEEIYRCVCQGCHMADGRGAQGAGTYPALAENPNLASAQFTAATVALGRHNMPHFAPQKDLGEFEAFVTMHLDDAEIAAVVNYVRSHFGNRYADELTAADVAKLHP
jgi:mono/diheme cytochrome c family protein